MRFFFFILIAPNFILAQEISEYQKNSPEQEYFYVRSNSPLKKVKNIEWKFFLGIGKYSQKKYSSLQSNNKLGNVIHLSIKKPIFNNFYAGYSLMRLATEASIAVSESNYQDIMTFNSLSLEWNLFGPSHLFDIGAMGSLGLSRGKYIDMSQVIDFFQIQPAFRVFGILRVHLLNNSHRALDICIGPQVILDQKKQITRNIIILGVNSSVDI